MPDAPVEFKVSPLLKTKYLGRKYVYLKSVNSTSTYLADMDRENAVHGTIVAADQQTAGRGRMDRTWHSPPGENLYFSVLLLPELIPAKAPQLALVTAAALIRVLKKRFPGLYPGVKWPNDILVQGRKLAGILCEMKTEMNDIHRVIIGIGINVNSTIGSYPQELRESAISLLDATGSISNRQELIADIAAELENMYEQWLKKGLAPLIRLLEENSAMRDQEVIVLLQNREIQGTARGLSDEGYLILETADGIVQLPAGEVLLTKRTM